MTDRKWRGKRSQLVLGISALSIMVVLTAVLGEALVRVGAVFSPQIKMALFPTPVRAGTPTVPDSELMVRGNPQYPGHDKNGFRNSTAMEKADIVTIGDSQTYGWNVSPQQAWPNVLHEMSSCSVYNMAVDGIGPLQYAALTREALQLKPRLILVGIYFGNDFYDSWDMYRFKPGEYPVPKELLHAALDRERNSPLSREAEQFWVSDASPWSVDKFLSEHSGLWRFGHAIKDRLLGATSVFASSFQQAVAALTPKQLEYTSLFEGDNWKTILTSRYREIAEGTKDPRIRVGYSLTLWAIGNISETASQNEATVIFVLLPTKENVFVNRVINVDKHPFLEKLTKDEDQNREGLIRYMEKNSIAYVDMTPVLRSLMQQPYPENVDGHPNAIGHRAIASRLREVIGTCNASFSPAKISH
jgi:hypothetical protein